MVRSARKVRQYEREGNVCFKKRWKALMSDHGRGLRQLSGFSYSIEHFRTALTSRKRQIHHAGGLSPTRGNSVSEVILAA
jgi:hypothetical protein